MEVRRELVAKILEERPWCERCLIAIGANNLLKGANPNRSVVVHEKRLRSAGGSIVDEDENTMFALCATCHREIHDHPARSQEEGYLEKRFGTSSIAD